MKRVGVAVVGCGWAGLRHASAFDRHEADILWAIDPAEERASQVAGIQSVTRTSKDIRDALADARVDAVDLCVPHDLHSAYSVRAMKAGKHVLCEKPIARTLAEADEMITASRRNARLLMIAENELFNPVYQRIHQMISEGAIGKPVMAHMDRSIYWEDSIRRDRPWFLDNGVAGGGIMMMGGSHCFSVLTMILGAIEVVYAVQAPNRVEGMQGDDTSLATLRFAGGAIGTVLQSYVFLNEVTRNSREYHTLRIDGTTGSIQMRGPDDPTVQLIAPVPGQSSHELADTTISIPEADTFELEVAHFLQCMKSNSSPVSNAVSLRGSLEVILAAYESIDTGSPVRLPIEQERPD